MRRLIPLPIVGVLLLAGCGAQITDEARSRCIDSTTFAIVGYDSPTPSAHAAALVEARELCETLAEGDPRVFMERYGSAE